MQKAHFAPDLGSVVPNVLCGAGSDAEMCKPLVEEVSTQCSSSTEQEGEAALPQIPDGLGSSSFIDYPGASSVSAAASEPDPDTYIANGVEYSVGLYNAVIGIPVEDTRAFQ
jgi:hypothetical protein